MLIKDLKKIAKKIGLSQCNLTKQRKRNINVKLKNTAKTNKQNKKNNSNQGSCLATVKMFEMIN